MKTITRNLRKLQGNLTLRAFSEKCGIGQSTMHNYLKGRDMQTEIAKQICIKLGCTMDWLCGLSDKEDKSTIGLKLEMVKTYIDSDIKEKQELLTELSRKIDIKAARSIN